MAVQQEVEPAAPVLPPPSTSLLHSHLLSPSSLFVVVGGTRYSHSLWGSVIFICEAFRGVGMRETLCGSLEGRNRSLEAAVAAWGTAAVVWSWEIARNKSFIGKTFSLETIVIGKMGIGHRLLEKITSKRGC